MGYLAEGLLVTIIVSTTVIWAILTFQAIMYLIKTDPNKEGENEDSSEH